MNLIKFLIITAFGFLSTLSFSQVTPKNPKMTKETLVQISNFLRAGEYRGFLKPGKTDPCLIHVQVSPQKYQVMIQDQKSKKAVVFDLNDSVNTPTNASNYMGGTWVGEWIGDMAKALHEKHGPSELMKKVAARVSWEGGKEIISDGWKYREFSYLLHVDKPVQTKSGRFMRVSIGSKLYYKSGFGSKSCYLKI